MPQTKQQQDHTKRWQSVEDQAPYGEHINSKACGTHLRRASSHLHMPLICIFTKKKPLWLSLISKPLPTASSAHAGLTKERQPGCKRVLAGTTHAHPDDTQIHTNAQNQFLHMLYTNVQRQSKQKSERELVRSGDVSIGRAHLISTPPSSLPRLPFSSSPLVSLFSHHQVPGDERPVIIHSL